jgi:hypothetical protein
VVQVDAADSGNVAEPAAELGSVGVRGQAVQGFDVGADGNVFAVDADALAVLARG